VNVYEPEQPPRLAWSMWKRFLIAMAAIVVLSAAATATAALLQVKSVVDIYNANSHPIPGIGSALDDVAPGKPQTILVLGSDRRYIDIVQKNPTRSDTIILVRLDPNKEATAVLNIPRDLKTDITLPNGRIVTDKINAAYALGGPKLSVKTIKKLLGIQINHVVNVNFGGFRRAVNRLGCVYADVDRKYFNDNNPPNGGYPRYAAIDIEAGYQKLCGQDALDYVRFRHLDTDLVRAARQQDFLRQAKEQIGVGKLFSDRNALLKIFSRYSQMDIHSDAAILRLLKLVVLSAGHPIREVHFRGEPGPTYVTSTQEQIMRTVDEFLNVQSSKGPRTGSSSKKTSKRKKGQLAPGLQRDRISGEDQAISSARKLPFPVYFPTVSRIGSTYAKLPRTYDIYDRAHHRYRAYRIVVDAPGIGEYYGIQGMNWTAPPILDNPSETRKMRGRSYDLFFDGSRLRLVAWRTKRAVYWVSNTLLETLTNAQMLDIARSLTQLKTGG
jgi:polyisoprenyl-teichoic acid--peptidoglycan teichoic acid transferase